MEEINMMSERMKKIGSILLCMLMIFLLLPAPISAAGAIDLDADVTLTIQYKNRQSGSPYAGVSFRIYRVADVDAYAYSRFTLTEAFQDSGVAVDNLDSEGWQKAANTLAGYVQLQNMSPLDTGKTAANGSLTFPTAGTVSMKPGLYLVIGDVFYQSTSFVTAEPFLVSLPVLDEQNNTWLYDGTVLPKSTVTPIIPDIKEDIKVIKVWEDSGYEYSRPADVTAVLLRNGKEYDSVILNQDNNWTHRWTGLDADYVWSVIEETVPDGYTVSVRKEGITFVITNTYHPEIETTDKQVIKVWDDHGSTETRPSSIVVELLADGRVVDTVTLSALNNWKHHWAGLDASHRYSVQEKYVPDGYTDSVTVEGNTFIITNTRPESVETVTRQVIKIWEDSGYEANRPAEITAELLADGKPYDTALLNPDNNWTYQWTGLAPDVTWTVREAAVPENYTSVIREDGVVFVITNTYIPPYIPPEPVDRAVLKVWKDDGHSEERPAEVQAVLLCDGEVYEIVTLNEAGGWKHQWTGLDGTKEWTVEEYTVLEKYTSSVAQDGDLFVITNTYTEIPQTGQLWWPVPMLLAAGMGLILVGLLRRRGMDYEE